MIFNSLNGPAIFIHVPKTGGNTIQQHLFSKGLSLDDMTMIQQHQDGVDRFGVKGQYTIKKHMKLSRYLKHEELRSFDIYTCIRRPLDRLVSFYFSPHRHAKIDKSSGKVVFPETVLFDIDEFAELVQKKETAIEKISIENQHGIPCIPSNIKIMRTENLKQDAWNILKLDIKCSRNVSPYKQLAIDVRSDTAVQKLVHNSKHRADQEFFYG